MSNARIACIGAILGPALVFVLVALGADSEQAFSTKTLVQAHITGALLAVALFGK